MPQSLPPKGEISYEILAGAAGLEPATAGFGVPPYICCSMLSDTFQNIYVQCLTPESVSECVLVSLSAVELVDKMLTTPELPRAGQDPTSPLGGRLKTRPLPVVLLTVSLHHVVADLG